MTALRVLEADYDDPLHRDAIVDALDSYARDPAGGGAALTAKVREALVPALRLQPTARVLLAFAGDAPVGIAICFLGFSTFAARPLLNIHDLAVVPEWRGRGVGRALLAAAEQRARGGLLQAHPRGPGDQRSGPRALRELRLHGLRPRRRRPVRHALPDQAAGALRLPPTRASAPSRQTPRDRSDIVR